MWKDEKKQNSELQEIKTPTLNKDGSLKFNKKLLNEKDTLVVSNVLRNEFDLEKLKKTIKERCKLFKEINCYNWSKI